MWVALGLANIFQNGRQGRDNLLVRLGFQPAPRSFWIVAPFQLLVGDAYNRWKWLRLIVWARSLRFIGGLPALSRFFVGRSFVRNVVARFGLFCLLVSLAAHWTAILWTTIGLSSCRPHSTFEPDEATVAELLELTTDEYGPVDDWSTAKEQVRVAFLSDQMMGDMPFVVFENCTTRSWVSVVVFGADEKLLHTQKFLDSYSNMSLSRRLGSFYSFWDDVSAQVSGIIEAGGQSPAGPRSSGLADLDHEAAALAADIPLRVGSPGDSVLDVYWVAVAYSWAVMSGAAPIEVAPTNGLEVLVGVVTGMLAMMVVVFVLALLQSLLTLFQDEFGKHQSARRAFDRALADDGASMAHRLKVERFLKYKQQHQTDADNEASRLLLSPDLRRATDYFKFGQHLERFPVFGVEPLGLDFIHMLAERCQQTHYGPQDIIWLEGQIETKITFLLSGVCESLSVRLGQFLAAREAEDGVGRDVEHDVLREVLAERGMAGQQRKSVAETTVTPKDSSKAPQLPASTTVSGDARVSPVRGDPTEGWQTRAHGSSRSSTASRESAEVPAGRVSRWRVFRQSVNLKARLSTVFGVKSPDRREPDREDADSKSASSPWGTRVAAHDIRRRMRGVNNIGTDARLLGAALTQLTETGNELRRAEEKDLRARNSSRTLGKRCDPGAAMLASHRLDRARKMRASMAVFLDAGRRLPGVTPEASQQLAASNANTNVAINCPRASRRATANWKRASRVVMRPSRPPPGRMSVVAPALAAQHSGSSSRSSRSPAFNYIASDGFHGRTPACESPPRPRVAAPQTSPDMSSEADSADSDFARETDTGAVHIEPHFAPAARATSSKGSPLSTMRPSAVPQVRLPGGIWLPVGAGRGGGGRVRGEAAEPRMTLGRTAQRNISEVVRLVEQGRAARVSELGRASRLLRGCSTGRTSRVTRGRSTAQSTAYQAATHVASSGAGRSTRQTAGEPDSGGHHSRTGRKIHSRTEVTQASVAFTTRQSAGESARTSAPRLGRTTGGSNAKSRKSVAFAGGQAAKDRDLLMVSGIGDLDVDRESGASGAVSAGGAVEQHANICGSVALLPDWEAFCWMGELALFSEQPGATEWAYTLLCKHFVDVLTIDRNKFDQVLCQMPDWLGHIQRVRGALASGEASPLEFTCARCQRPGHHAGTCPRAEQHFQCLVETLMEDKTDYDDVLYGAGRDAAPVFAPFAALRRNTNEMIAEIYDDIATNHGQDQSGRH